MNIITTKLVKDGNSMAVRIPKSALEMSGLEGDIEMVVSKNKIIIKKSVDPRAGWVESLQKTPYCLDGDLAEWDGVVADGLND